MTSDKDPQDPTVKDDDYNDEAQVEGWTLKTGKEYAIPVLHNAQVMFFCFGDHTVLTVRRRTNVSSMANVFLEVPQEMRDFSNEIETEDDLISAQGFLTLLLNELIEQNWYVKDQLKGWKITLEKEIHERVLAGQSRHLLDLDQIASSALNIIEPFAQSATRVFTQDYREPVGQNQNVEADSDAEAVKFILKEQDLYRDVATNAQKLIESLQFTRSICSKLCEYHQQQSQQRQSDTLNTLTVLTSTFLPMQLSTGVFGMNFEHMPELAYEYSYLIFWLINVFLICLILSFWKSRGFL